jgi:hypothetical protein
MTLTALTGFAQQTGDVIYVYQKDGNILPLLREEIREMSYTIEDTGGLTESEATMQWIVTADSTYKIPVNDIDSISFVTPATVYQPGVIRIEQGLMDYVESCDSLTIHLAANTPASLMPKAGDKLVTLEMNDKFEAGFAGIVKSVNGTTVVCDAVDLEEIFRIYYHTSVTDLVNEAEDTLTVQTASARARAEGKEVEIRLPTLSWALGAEFSKEIKQVDDLAWKAGIKWEISLKPTFRVKATMMINGGTQLYGHIKTNLQTQETLSLYGGLEWSKDFGVKVVKKPIAPLCFFYMKPGVFVKAGATLSFNWIWTQDFNYKFTFDCSNKRKEQPVKATWTADKPTNNFDFQTMLSGNISWGFFLEVGVACVSEKLGNISVRTEFGDEVVGNTILYNNDLKDASLDTKLYEFLKGRTVELNIFSGSNLQGKLFDNQLSFPIGISTNYNVATFDVVPTFSDVQFERDGNDGLASAKISGNCIIPVKTGFIVSDKKNNKLDSWTTNGRYRSGGDEISKMFSGLEEDQAYVLNPKIDIFGFDLKANPPAGMKADVFPVEIINFEQTDANYSEQKGYEYDGIGYYYKFNVTTTVELNPDAEEDVVDWGYIYHDIYNQDKKISCAGLGSNPYADTRYAYYYDEPQRTVSLTAYVQYKDEEDIKKGGTHTYMVKYGGCPDNNHPHMIDMGLPSGTKWSCCNVGASAPELLGGYYAWGEKRTKSEYWGDTYQFWYDADNNGYYDMDFDDEGMMHTQEITNIGSDIAGTSYDVATATMGAPWHIPTVEQIAEMIKYTTSEWKVQKGVAGRQFKSKNGGVIFLPAVGYFTSDFIRDSGSAGYYWTSTLSNKYDPQLYSYALWFNQMATSSAGYFFNGIRFYGCPIRPVQ